MRQRLIVAAVLQNDSAEILITKMSQDHGVYPGEWGIVGGGIELDESLAEALQREVMEETQLTISNLKAAYFFDEIRTKQLRDGESEEQHLIYLISTATANGTPILNDEWVEWHWVAVKDLSNYKLNAATRKTFSYLGLI